MLELFLDAKIRKSASGLALIGDSLRLADIRKNERHHTFDEQQPDFLPSLARVHGSVILPSQPSNYVVAASHESPIPYPPRSGLWLSFNP
jgi:hypothetical protein